MMCVRFQIVRLICFRMFHDAADAIRVHVVHQQILTYFLEAI